MPTARGWLTVGLGAALWGAGRMFGSGPLEQIGFALLVLVVIATVIVNSRRHRLDVVRQVSPERARSGQPVEVKLSFANDGRGSAPLLLLDDRIPLELAGNARFALNGVEPGGRRETAYELRPPRRGRYEIGPLDISFVDPFGLAQTHFEVIGSTPLLVHPRIETLTLPRDLGHQRSMSTSALRQLSGARGEDFYTLREYVEGDDLRKIHWPSTAKRAKPMIRQEEMPWHTRATILLDDRLDPHDGFEESSSFERCVEAAASLADLYHRSGYNFRVTGATSSGVPLSRGSQHFHRCLDMLAVIAAHRGGRDKHDALLVRLAELESGTTGEGTLVVVSGEINHEAALAISRCGRRYRQILTILFPAHRYGSGATRDRWEGEQRVHEAIGLLTRAGVRSIVLGPGESLASGWSSMSSGMLRGGVKTWDQRPEPA
jgi:uncharacterized protein (DUF58 family)